MPDISNLSWFLQLSAVGGVFGAAGICTGYLGSRIIHRNGLAREEQLRDERLANEAKLLEAVRTAQTSPGPVDVIWTAEKAMTPYSPQSRPVSPVPAYVPVSPAPVAEVFARDTTETMVNPPMFQPKRVTQYKPSPSPLADTAARLRWADIVGPEVVDRLTTTDVLHLEQVTKEDGEDRSASRFHGFQPATA